MRDELTALIAPIVRSQELELWELEYHSRAGGGLLRIYIDSPNGVTVEDCERVSRAVSTMLDKEDPIPGEYTLEVSSPGLDRVLRTGEHFARFVGERVRIETNAAIDGRKRFSGRLSRADRTAIAIDVEGRAVTIPLEAIHKGRLVPAL